MRKIGLLGCGNIASIIARHQSNMEIVALFDRNPEKLNSLTAFFPKATAHANFTDFINTPFEILLEAASIGAVRDYAETALEHGKDLVIMSVGALADRPFKEHLEEFARARGKVIRIPSGALFGLDNVKIGRISGVDRLLLRTTKHPSSLDMAVERRTLLFHGPASECIKRYPRNINVAVSLSLAAGCEAEVELWADPAATHNRHEVLFSGEFGETSIKIINRPSPDNPATSYSAALSALILLQDLDQPLLIGT
ncbi:MAG: aspartate dehydrogenase [Chromatiales bacterium]|jgi:aspartate dehydrogenase